MVCIYCGGKTHVTNSRQQKRLGQVWRRRSCKVCSAVFTTNEAVDLTTSLSVRSGSSHSPFNRDELFVSILRAVGHRMRPVEDAGALTATIIATLRANTASASTELLDIARATHSVLKRFDRAAAVQYAAYHKL